MTRGITLLGATLALALASAPAGCKHDATGTPGNSHSHSNSSSDAAAPRAEVPAPRADGGPAGATANAGGDASAAPSGDSTERIAFEGTATGAAADPPIREFVPRVVVAPWTGAGTARIEVPAGTGTVTGTLTMGDLVFDVRGYRTGTRVRATLDQRPPANAPAPAPDAALPAMDLFSGTLDGDVEGATLRGRWEASAQGGMQRRRGTVETHRR